MNLWRVTLNREGVETSRELHRDVDGTTVGNLFTRAVRSVTFDIGSDGVIRWERADD